MGAAPLLQTAVQPSWSVIHGRDAEYLVEVGERKARKTGQPVVLKLKTGDRGRPGTRIMLPPRPLHAMVNSGSKTLRTKSVSGAKSRNSTKRTTPLPNSSDQVPSALPQLDAVCRQMEQLTRAVGRLQIRVELIENEKAQRSDIETAIKDLRAIIETEIKDLRAIIETEIKDLRAIVEPVPRQHF
jgi:hypothetical protein